ncbi:hypothetical protein PV963_39000 [Streptomyces coeruleorubidus]|uniref:hypothetical protein n=1 Tax=Streptomyces coeruleorubidus TaxID=116188 RepID=UPI00237EFC41|nr:hypothetical protein [Streptomyces coeruleorubidus]WDV55909.1 hypothetical protein PV963_39000 [Streptomyces coeruleorubidus]
MTTSTHITTPCHTGSTAAEVIAGTDLTGRRAVVTGSSHGFGRSFVDKVTLVGPGPYPTDWPGAPAGNSEPNPLYDGVRQALAEGLDLSDMGDPKAVGPALLTIVDAENPPLRVSFGRPPIELVQDHCARKLAAWADREHVSLAAHR